MFKSPFFSDSEKWLANLPGRKRRWQITVFRNELVDGGIKNTIAEEFDCVSSCDPLTGRITSGNGILNFIDKSGREIVISSMPFIAKELMQETEDDQR